MGTIGLLFGLLEAGFYQVIEAGFQRPHVVALFFQDIPAGQGAACGQPGRGLVQLRIKVIRHVDARRHNWTCPRLFSFSTGTTAVLARN